MGKGSSEERRLYKLWWQYLRESEGYKKWLNESLDDYLSSAAPETNIRPNEVLMVGLPERFNNPEERKWIDLYARVGDIRNPNFEEWFENIESVLPIPIEDYSDKIQEDIDACWMYCYHDMRDKEERDEPIKAGFEYADMLKDRLFERLKKSDRLYVVIDPEANLETLKVALAAIVNQRKRQDDHWYRTKRKYRLPIAGRIRINELEQYLAVYLLAKPYIHSGQNVEWEKIIEDISPEYLSDENEVGPDDVRRIHNRYLNKALKIIQNVEKGVFPGQYEPEYPKK